VLTELSRFDSIAPPRPCDVRETVAGPVARALL